jgi:hypothetical protein
VACLSRIHGRGFIATSQGVGQNFAPV